MTFATLFADFQILALFLLAGYVLRELLPPLQRLFLPSSVIGGTLALLGSQQLLGLWTIPKSFSAYSGQLIALIMCCLIWGVTLDRKRVAGYVDYLCLINTTRFAQIGIGALTGIVLRYFWTDLPLGWGTMGFSAYFGGHGTVAAYGGVFESLGHGVDYIGMGMIMATLGLLCAVTVGMVWVNIGVRRGWTEFITADSRRGKHEERGLLPKEKRGSIGAPRVPGESVNALAFQLGMLLALIWLGKTVLKLLGAHVSPMFNAIPNMMYGIVGALIVWPLMCKFKLQEYVDRKTCSSLSGLALEILITSAIATMNIKILSKFFTPIFIQFLVMTILTAFICFWYNKRIAEKEWFEKALFVFGQSTGATPTGLALVRAVDPDSVATPGEAHAISAGLSASFLFWIPALLPFLATTAPWMEVALGLTAALFFWVAGWMLFRKKVLALGR